MTEWRNVFSSMASRVGYEAESEQLLVTFAKSGKTGIYEGVDYATFDRLSKAASVGDMIESEIKPNYDFAGYLE